MRFSYRFSVLFSSSLVCILISLTAFISNKYFEEKNSLISKAKTSYRQALSNSKIFLSNHTLEVKDLVEDYQLSEHAYGVQAKLAGFLKHGELDQLALYREKDCVLIAKETLDKEIDELCPKKGSQDSELYWEENSTHKALLNVKIPIRKNQKYTYWLIGRVLLDDDWLMLSPPLKALDKQLIFELSTKRDVDGLQVDFDGIKNGKNIAGLFSRHWALRGMKNSYYFYSNFAEKIVWPFFILAVLFTLISILGLWLRIKNLEKNRNIFFEWTKSLFEGEVHPRKEKSLHSFFLNQEKWYKEASVELKKIKDNESNENKELVRKYQNLEQKNIRLDSELKAFRQRVSMYEVQDSLASQVEKNALKIILAHESQLNNLKKISKIELPDLTENSKIFNHIIQNWKQGVSQLGSRKFLRSLCETPGENFGSHKLDEQLNILFTASDSMTHSSLLFSDNFFKMISEKDYSLEYLSHWYALSVLKMNSSHKEIGLKEAIVAGSKLSGVIDRNDQANFELVFPKIFSNQFPILPDGIWNVWFYHVFSFLKDAKGGMAKGRVNIKENNSVSYYYIFISLSCSSLDSLKSFKPNAFHWEKMTHLLLPYNANVTFSPGENTALTITLEWKKEENIRCVNSGNKTDAVVSAVLN